MSIRLTPVVGLLPLLVVALLALLSLEELLVRVVPSAIVSVVSVMVSTCPLSCWTVRVFMELPTGCCCCMGDDEEVDEVGHLVVLPFLTTPGVLFLVLLVVVVAPLSTGTCSIEVRVRPSGSVSVLVMVLIFPFWVIDVRVPERTLFVRGTGMLWVGVEVEEVVWTGTLFVVAPVLRCCFVGFCIFAGNSSPVLS